MPNFQQRGVTWLAGKLVDQVSVVCVYIRGSDELTVPATLGSQLLKTSDRLGNVKMERTDRDFIFQSSLLTFDDTNLIIPRLGDVVRMPLTLPDGSAANWETIQAQWQDIVWTWDGSTAYEEYGVMAPNGEAPWRWSDPFRTMLRVHSKYLGLH